MATWTEIENVLSIDDVDLMNLLLDAMDDARPPPKKR